MFINPRSGSVVGLDRLRSLNEALVLWMREHPVQAVGAGLGACAVGAGLMVVAPPVIAVGAQFVSFGAGLAVVGGGVAGFSVVVGVVGQSPDAIRGGLWLGGASVLGGGAAAGAGLALQAAGIVAATGGGALVAGGVVLAVAGGLRLGRTRRHRQLRDVRASVRHHGRTAGYDPDGAPTMLLDLGNSVSDS